MISMSLSFLFLIALVNPAFAMSTPKCPELINQQCYPKCQSGYLSDGTKTCWKEYPGWDNTKPKLKVKVTTRAVSAAFCNKGDEFINGKCYCKCEAGTMADMKDKTKCNNGYGKLTDRKSNAAKCASGQKLIRGTFKCLAPCPSGTERFVDKKIQKCRQKCPTGAVPSADKLFCDREKYDRNPLLFTYKANSNVKKGAY
jgi:hypothetical protein